jgi:hypothetical protein
MIFEPGRKHLFLYISSTNTDTLVPSLYQCVEPPAKKSFECCLSHLWIISKRSTTFLEPLYETNSSHSKHFFMNILCLESFCPQKLQKRRLLFGSRTLKHSRHFGYSNQPLKRHISYLGCHKAGLRWYLVIYIENLYIQ